VVDNELHPTSFESPCDVWAMYCSVVQCPAYCAYLLKSFVLRVSTKAKAPVLQVLNC
jgi:hypothetical protein